MATRRAAHAGDNIAAARKMLSSLPDCESDEDGSSLDALSDSGEDDPDLASSRPVCRPAGPGFRDGVDKPRKKDGSARRPTSASPNQPGHGPVSVTSDTIGPQQKPKKEKGEIVPRNVPRSSNVSNLAHHMAQASSSQQVFAPEPSRSSTGSTGDRTSANLKKAKWKQDAIQEGMRLVEVPPCRCLIFTTFDGTGTGYVDKVLPSVLTYIACT